MATSTPAAPSPAAAALLDARPPVMDRFSYLTLIEQNLSPAVLPTLHEILQDASLTQEIGWDLVDMLVPLLPASEACLDDVVRLGNPREVILKVLEALEGLRRGGRRQEGGGNTEEEEEDDDDDDDDDNNLAAERAANDGEDPATAESTTQTFVVLLGMLGVLHRRIKTKYPSRFLESTLRAILAAYRPDRPAMTTAVLGLVRSLAGRRRPPPPVRRSDSQLSLLAMGKTATAASSADASRPDSPANAAAKPGLSSTPARGHLVRSTSAIAKVGLDDGGGLADAAAVSVPDPEAEDQVEPSEPALQQRLLQSFVTCVLEAYVNANEVAWAPRLVEYYRPARLVPGRASELRNFREDPNKIAQDAAVSQLVALALDLGLKYSDSLVEGVCRGPVRRNPLARLDLAAGGIDSIALSTGGVVCLLAYWVFSADVFKADAPTPNLRVFPDHYAMLEAFFAENASAQIARTPGTAEALVTVGLWLDHHGLYSQPGRPAASPSASSAEDFMPYIHLLTLCAVFHPTLAVRNAATELAGAVLHADPDPDDRLKILQDLLENCMFASLKACAVTWLREEILAAAAAAAAAAGPGKTPAVPAAPAAPAAALFAGPEAVEQLQYAIFPDMQTLREATLAKADEAGADDKDGALLDYWLQNAPFLLQAANFAYFLFCSERFRATVVPPGMGPAIEQRYVEPLLAAAARLRGRLGEGKGARVGGGDGGSDGHAADDAHHVALDLDVLSNCLGSLKLS